jgi:2TM domain
MDYDNQLKDPRDRMLWEIAKKRASFKTHVLTYVVVIGFLWALWLLKGDDYNSRIPWPVWPTFGWGIGIVFHFLGAYVFPKENSVEKEFEKLKKEQNR